MTESKTNQVDCITSEETVCHFHYHWLKDSQGRWVITTHRNDIDCDRPESVVYKVVKILQ